MVELSHWSRNTDEEIASQIQALREHLADTQAYSGRLEMELVQRLEARQATELQHPTLLVRVDYGTQRYDIPKLMALTEMVPPDEWAKAWHPETVKEVPVPAGLDMRIANTWRKRFGTDISLVFDAARLPGAPRLVIKPKGAVHEV